MLILAACTGDELSVSPTEDNATQQTAAVHRAFDSAAAARAAAGEARTACAILAVTCTAANEAVAAAARAQAAARAALDAETLTAALRAEHEAQLAAQQTTSASNAATQAVAQQPVTPDDVPLTPTEPVTPGPPFEEYDLFDQLIALAWDSAQAANLSAYEAVASCFSFEAACGAAREAINASERAGIAAQAALRARSLYEVQRAAYDALLAAQDAARAADLAYRISLNQPVSPGPPPKEPADECESDDPPPQCEFAAPPIDAPFVLQPGNERKLSSGVFLVCPQGGSICNVQSVTRNDSGGFSIQLAESSGKPFYWNSGAGLFSGGPLSPYDYRTVRSVGSQEVHVITCAQSLPCEVKHLRFNAENIVEWASSASLHVSTDKTGFFLLGSKVVTYPDGRQLLFTCPTGCGINRIYKEGPDRYLYHYSESWGAPTVTFLEDDGRLGSPVPGQPDPPGQPPPGRTPPIQTRHYTDLPAALTKFPVDHWELSDEIQYQENDITGDVYIERNEVVCPGVGSEGNKCRIIRPTEMGKQVQHLTTDFVLDALEGKIIAQGGGRRDQFGYIVFSHDLQKFNEALLKRGAGQQLSDDEQALLGGFNALGYWGQHSAFGSMLIPYHDDRASFHWFAFGDLYGAKRGGRPTADQGGATWRGHMFGSWTALEGSRNAGGMGGSSELVYDFANNDLDLTLEVTLILNNSGRPYGGQRIFMWKDVKQNSDGSFFIQGNHKEGTDPDPKLGILDGDFYGPNAEEVAGIFERMSGNYHVQGVFGGTRQSE